MKISRTLVIDADFDGEAFVWVIDSDTPQLYAMAHELVVCENKVDSEAETVSKCKGE